MKRYICSSVIRIIMAGMPVKTWKASPDDIRVLKALKKAKVEKNESDRVRAGLRALAREKLGTEGMKKNVL